MNGAKVLGVAAVGALLVVAAPAERAQAVSLINPGASAAVQQDAKQEMTTEVRWHHHWGRHWGWRHHHRHWGWHRGHHWGWHHHRHW